MPSERRLYVGPSLRRLRRDLGLTQSDMAQDLEVSASYIALLERNHRPLRAEMLVRLAQTYRLDVAALAAESGDDSARLQSALRDPMFGGIELKALEVADAAANFPGVTEAFLRLYTAYREEQLALADRTVEGREGEEAADPVAESRRFLAARRNSFPLLDDAAERLAQAVAANEGLAGHLKAQGIDTLVHYPTAPHLQPAYAALGLSDGSLPISEALHRQVLSLPLWPGMTFVEVDAVVESIRSFG
jgi:transcriptional regulator with XRE-family HTH domain